jgi:hypothetical protein
VAVETEAKTAEGFWRGFELYLTQRIRMYSKTEEMNAYVLNCIFHSLTLMRS